MNTFRDIAPIKMAAALFLALIINLSTFDLSLGGNSAQECAMCHINWVDAFYIEGHSTVIADLPEKKLVADEMMCYSCHDGSIVDSRLRVWETSRHKVGAKPSADISVPKDYPLDENGGLTCATCHSAHGVDTKPGMAETIFLRESNKNSEMCRRCHISKKGGPDDGNHPIGVSVDKLPHLIAEGGGKLGDKNGVICQTCHTPHGSTNDHFLVIPNSKESLTHSQLCEACHSKSPDLKSKESARLHSHPVDVPLMEEAELPEKWESGKRPYLSFDGRINCITCHSPHKATKKNHLLVTSNEKGALCITCHTSKKSIYGTKHDTSLFYPDEENADGFRAGQKGTCSSCHFMHKGKGPKMWARAVDEQSMSALCFSCHSKGKVAGKSLTGEHSHPVDVAMKSDDEFKLLPLFDDKGRKGAWKGAAGKVSCPSCHDVHRWSPASGDKGGKGVDGDGESSFLRIAASGESKLCKTCHKTQATVVKTKHDMDHIAPKSKNEKGDGPKRSGVCGACHSVHNAESIKLWGRKKGRGMGSIEPLCTSCHSAGKLADEKMTGKVTHPTGVKVKLELGKKLRLPLHMADGKRSPEGDLSCATCHDVHRWSPEDAGMRGEKEKEGDGNNSFLRKRYEATNDLCRECHENKFSIEATKHDLGLTAPSSRNSKMETIEKSGLCGTCHMPHNGTGAKLWARSAGQGVDAIEKTCTSCHSIGNMAEEKVTGDRSHPLGVRPDMQDPMKRYLPLHDKKGKIISVDGGVSCATCHDVHNWKAGSKVGPGERKIEGDRFDSFLRVPNDDEAALCSACHEENALVLETDHDLRITAPSAKNMNGKNTAKSGVCGSCHVVHNAKGNTLWGNGIGEGKNRIESMCKGCHVKKKSASKKEVGGPGHPMNMKVSDSKDTLKRDMSGFYKEGIDGNGVVTELPLFSQQGNKSSRGDITCATCHNPHRWDPAKKSKGEGKEVEGDGGNSFLRKSNLGGSGLCITCHREKSYVKGTDHDMSVSNPSIKNVTNNTVYESGVCSSCHVPHGASGSYKLWATNMSNQSDFLPEKLCLGCHSNGGSGAAKRVHRFRHPRGIIVSELSKASEKTYSPLYDKKGNAKQSGAVACGTCHNPHIWQAGELKEGSGKNEEGNNRNSFLRFKSSANICKDCHGFDGLIRYKFFHSNRVRTGGL